jgi:hypothetical protein
MAKIVKKKKTSIKIEKAVKKAKPVQKTEEPKTGPVIREIRLLEEGFQPEKNKIGSEFKGKNRVIIA